MDLPSMAKSWMVLTGLMTRRKAPHSSLPLFPLPTRERAFELVARFPLGSSFQQRMNKCQGACCRNGASHGPYWVVTVPRSAGKPRQRFVGSAEKKREIQAAWALISAELAEKEALPAVQELRHLEMLAGRRPLARTAHDVLDVPILSFGGGRTRIQKNEPHRLGGVGAQSRWWKQRRSIELSGENRTDEAKRTTTRNPTPIAGEGRRSRRTRPAGSLRSGIASSPTASGCCCMPTTTSSPSTERPSGSRASAGLRTRRSRSTSDAPPLRRDAAAVGFRTRAKGSRRSSPFGTCLRSIDCPTARRRRMARTSSRCSR